jgi:hypothetical protein
MLIRRATIRPGSSLTLGMTKRAPANPDAATRAAATPDPATPRPATPRPAAHDYNSRNNASSTFAFTVRRSTPRRSATVL